MGISRREVDHNNDCYHHTTFDLTNAQEKSCQQILAKEGFDVFIVRAMVCLAV